MLKRLLVKNFVLIEHCELYFTNGFSAFTGETGAGKSLLIDAICLLSGERASQSFVKQGAQSAVVEGEFDFSKNRKAKEILSELNLNEEHVVVRREIKSDGKSSITIQNQIVTLSVLKQLIAYEIDIHSQHDTQYLLNKQHHITLVDEMISSALIAQVKDAYQKYYMLSKELKQALATTYNENEISFIEAEINEIEQANLSQEEENELQEAQKKIDVLEKSYKKLQQAVGLYEQDGGISEMLFEMNHLVSSIDNEEVEMIANKIKDHCAELDDALQHLHTYMNDIDISDAEIDHVQQRLFEIQRLKRKFGVSISLILEKQAQLQQQVAMIQNREAYISDMQEKIVNARSAFLKVAHVLSKERKEAALQLQNNIEKHCRELMLPYVQFVIDFQEIEGNEHGIDDVEFFISMNPGEMVRPLARVASGGELSRLMLGLKCVFSVLQGIQTVIFDEIDSGVSGSVASAIGVKMATLAQDLQVFSVTHLAQVAACAKHHYLVLKQIDNDRTLTKVTELDEKSRVEELAMISSGVLSDASIFAANELYLNSKEKVLSCD